MLSTQARSAFVGKDEGRAGWCGSSLGFWLCFVCADDVPERCARVGRLARGDIGAVRFLRYCLMTSGIRPSCSMVTAPGSLVADYRTLAQSSYCVRVGRLVEWGFRAVGVLRAGLKIGGIRPSCSWCSAPGSLVADYRTLVQFAFCVRA